MHPATASRHRRRGRVAKTKAAVEDDGRWPLRGVASGIWGDTTEHIHARRQAAFRTRDHGSGSTSRSIRPGLGQRSKSASVLQIET